MALYDLADVSPVVVARLREFTRTGRAWERTKRLLNSEQANNDPALRQTWETRLQRQEANMRGLC